MSATLSNRDLGCVLVFVAVLASSMTLEAAGKSRTPARHTVTIDASSFEPSALTVRAGDTVLYVNKDLVSHTATSQAAGFDSRGIPAGKSWTFRPAKKGEFAYICSFHPTMRAKLIVN